MNEDTEYLIIRAAQSLSYGESTEEVYETFVAEGVDPETAFLLVKAGQVFRKSRRQNPVIWTRFAWMT